MHLYIITRGIKHAVDRFISELQAKYLPFKYKGQDSILQVSVRPIQLWEIVFPKEHRDVMLKTILSGGTGETQHKKHRKWVTLLRKVLGIEKIPKYESEKCLPVYKEDIEIVGVGIKEDYTFEDGTEGI